MKPDKTTYPLRIDNIVSDGDTVMNRHEVDRFLAGHPVYCICHACGQKRPHPPGRICLYTRCPKCGCRMAPSKLPGQEKMAIPSTGTFAR